MTATNRTQRQSAATDPNLTRYCSREYAAFRGQPIPQSSPLLRNFRRSSLRCQSTSQLLRTRESLIRQEVGKTDFRGRTWRALDELEKQSGQR